MPNAPKTPGRHIRMTDAEWAEYQEEARLQGTDVSKVTRTLLQRWLRASRRKREREGEGK